MVILQPGLVEKEILQEVDGEMVLRRFLVHAPQGIDPEKNYPVVFFFHGSGGEAEGGQEFIGPLVEQGEVVGIYPQGIANSWNLGKEASTADDVAFVGLIMDELKGMTNLNLVLAFAVGYSNGAGFCHKIATDTNIFRGIASMASVLLESGWRMEPCRFKHAPGGASDSRDCG